MKISCANVRINIKSFTQENGIKFDTFHVTIHYDGTKLDEHVYKIMM